MGGSGADAAGSRSRVNRGFHTGRFFDAGVKFNMTPNGEHHKNGPVHCMLGFSYRLGSIRTHVSKL